MLLSIRGFQFGKGAGKGLRSAIGILPPRSDCSIGAVAARVRADVGLIARGARRWRLTCFRCTVPPRTDSNRHPSRSAGPGRERYGPGPRTEAGSVPQWVRVRVEKRTGRIRVVLASPASSLVTSTKVCSSKGPRGSTRRPPGRSCSRSDGGTCSGAADALILSNGACSFQPRPPSPHGASGHESRMAPTGCGQDGEHSRGKRSVRRGRKNQLPDEEP